MATTILPITTHTVYAYDHSYWCIPLEPTEDTGMYYAYFPEPGVQEICTVDKDYLQPISARFAHCQKVIDELEASVQAAEPLQQLRGEAEAVLELGLHRSPQAQTLINLGGLDFYGPRCGEWVTQCNCVHLVVAQSPTGLLVVTPRLPGDQQHHLYMYPLDQYTLEERRRAVHAPKLKLQQSLAAAEKEKHLTLKELRARGVRFHR